MLFLKRILARWVSEGVAAEDEVEYDDRKYPSLPSGQGMTRKARSGMRKSSNEVGSSGDFKNPLNITLYNAVGGRIIKFHSYDYNTDKSSETTYVVDSDENFEEALGKFIALEALKHNG